MYTPPAFRMDDLPGLHGTMRDAGLANLLTATPAGLVATPLPLFLDPDDGPFGTLHGHLARANPQWRTPAQGDAMALFMGPDAYVSPSWYPSKQEHHRVVPTWNYVAVHAYGPVEFYEDPDRLLALVTTLTRRHEEPRATRGAVPWAVSDAPADFIQGQLKGIVGLRLPITRLEGKRKLSQNRNAADRAGVRDALAASDRPADRAVAAVMPE
ncbi:FMN-binding negative transcriptional regulator [Falsiroseomonas stagni]|uniref:Negative transcriptional regulator, PaiB family n=1 Tax=Falsiroseomonas stagni DSM 19981 TaxID=1123062 RepID=A0A1I4CMR6_9PROT|nr:FMN-binding negative transcriptional regulator [Falsiroseomonas stagni]SFK82564.1 negative transcriptional regulator, PaiB family [Falsiroseomonas stagni DSM 19981]